MENHLEPTSIEWPFNKWTYIAFPGRRKLIVCIDPDNGALGAYLSELGEDFLEFTNAPIDVYKLYDIPVPVGSVID